MAWAALAAGAQAAGTALDTALSYNLNRSSTKHSTEYSLNASKELLQEESTINKKDYQWQKNLDYTYDSSHYYDLARRYAENSSKWQVTGLRNAGLNPILAATDGNFASTYGQGASSGSMGHASGSIGSGSGFHGNSKFSDTASTYATVDSALSSAQLSRVNADIASNTAQYSEQSARYKMLADKALAQKLQNESDAVAANTAKTLNDIEVSRARMHNDSFSFGFGPDKKGNSRFSFRIGGHALKSAFDKTVDLITNHSNSVDSSAKSVHSGSTSSDSSAKDSARSSNLEVKFTSDGIPYYEYVPRKSKRSHASRDRSMPDMPYHKRNIIMTR